MSDDPVFNRGELGPYLIERKLGQGAMGGVYLGKHKVLEVHHAIKMIHSRLLGDKTLIERFLREARNTAKMKHMNIVQVVGADLVDGIYYLAMEFVEGKTLEQLMRHPGLQLHDAVRYIHMMANALQYAHSRGIIHRDIKPANIMVNEEDIAKLMDFGLVRDIEQPNTDDGSEQLTMAGFIMGTPQYMPVEQWNGEGVDHRSDIYALGATLYVAISGKLPFPGKSPRDIFRRVLTSEAIDVRTHNDEIDDQLAAVVHKAIAPEKEDRFQSAEEFALALEQWWDAHPYQGTSLFKAPVLDETRAISGSGGSRAGTAAATRAVLTHHSSMNDSSPSSLNATGKSKAPLMAIVGLVAILGVVLGSWLIFGGGNDAANNAASDPVVAFKIGLEPDVATEAMPLAVASSSFSIPGTGAARVNGKPYEFGNALKLDSGLNKLTVRGAGSGERILFVLVDTTAPVLGVPALSASFDNVIPTQDSGFTLKGKVSDEGAGLQGLKLTLSVDGDPRTLVVDDTGSFEQTLPVDDKDVTLELQATDRAGNSTKALTFWVVPDRVSLRFADAWEPKGLYVTSREFEIAGKLSKARGVTLTVDGNTTEVADDGSFRASVTREPGAVSEIVIEATDWFGTKQTTSRSVFVDLEGPTLKLAAPSTVRLEKLPGSVKVDIAVDDADGAVLKVNGKQTSLGKDGDVSVDVPVDAFGEFKVTAEVTDPAGRSDVREATIQVKRLLYKERAKNEQGFREFERVSDGMVMVEVPGGEFERGDKNGVLGDAKPRNVTLTTYLIAKYEVSNEQFAKFLTATNTSIDTVILSGWLAKSEGRFVGLVPDGTVWTAAAGIEKLPVAFVTWAGSQAYCKWADEETGSLPSEAQWEYAARGADGRDYPWGNANPSYAKTNYDSNRAGTDSVMKYADGDSPFGVRNMAGNVEEWCLDWYTEGSYQRDDQRGADPALTTRPSGFDMRVVRGGSFTSPLAKTPKPNLLETDPSNLQTYARAKRLPDTGSAQLGFRPAARLPAE